jgi:predicted NBD/HSP70 family sugar kinase
VPFADMLESRLGSPLSINDDVATALLGEATYESYMDEKYVVYFILGTRI